MNYTAALWARFEDTPNDMGLLAIIADHYRDDGNDEYADCLEWCSNNHRIPYVYSVSGGYIWFGDSGFYETADKYSFTVTCSFDTYFLGAIGTEEHPDRIEYFTDSPTIPDAYLLLCRHWYAVMGVPA